MKFTSLIAIVLVVGLSACVPQFTQVPENGDLVGAFVASPRRTIDYVDNSQFHSELSAAMRAEISPIKISLSESFEINNTPVALDRWFYEVEHSNGEVMSCPIVSTRSFLPQLLFWVATVVWDRLHDELIFAPAKSYNVVNYVDLESGRVQRVEFLLRSAEPPC